MNGLERFLRTDPRDSGCERAMELLHVYAELVATDPVEAELTAQRRRRFAGLIRPQVCDLGACLHGRVQYQPADGHPRDRHLCSAHRARSG